MVMHGPSLFAGQRQDRDIRGVSPGVSGEMRGGAGARHNARTRTELFRYIDGDYPVTVGNLSRRRAGRLRMALAIWHDVLQ